MATLKEHQATMVQLLANGSGIPASASRLAHAMHDVLVYLSDGRNVPLSSVTGVEVVTYRPDATTPGLNDKALSKREKALKTDSPAKWPTPAEQRVKELENTIKQLKANNAKLKKDNEWLKGRMSARDDVPEQDGCRKDDTQVLGDGATRLKQAFITAMDDANKWSGCRREDTKAWEPECDHAYAHINMENKTLECGRCGHNVPWPDGFNPEPSKAPK